ncbi:MAG: WxcM-like domain-containing protein [Planctomycetota bacterium]|nr:WxcM-like domain-containing protein [Planctomycetota bacterium]
MRTHVIDTQKSISRNHIGEVNGYVISLYKDWEKLFEAEPKQVYLNVCFPGQSKGPHLHMRRWDFFATIRGSMRFVVKYGPKDYEEIEVSAADGIGVKVVVVPPAIPCLMTNIGLDEAWVINMPNPAWHPDNADNNPVDYSDYLPGR